MNQSVISSFFPYVYKLQVEFSNYLVYLYTTLFSGKNLDKDMSRSSRIYQLYSLLL